MAQRINRLLIQAEEAGHGLAVTAPTDVVLDPEQAAVQPDLLLIARDRLDIVREGVVVGAPDLVVEVLSEPTRRREPGRQAPAPRPPRRAHLLGR